LTFLAASALVLIVCATASWLPARAALAVSPLIALRRE
jgi:ABC-type antimicrobial peptide transport system permease subunit